MLIRPATADDVAAMHAIYAHHVFNGLGTFETEPPDAAEMFGRYRAVVDAGFPYYVADDAGRVLGYAYANHFRTRTAYRHTVEDSVYIDSKSVGRGLGTSLLDTLVKRCSEMGFRQMLALIGDSGNAASIGVHRRCGFAMVGTMQAVGRKFDRWVDVVIMQRALAPIDG